MLSFEWVHQHARDQHWYIHPIPEIHLNSTATAERERMNGKGLNSDGRTHAGEGQAHLKQLSPKSH